MSMPDPFNPLSQIMSEGGEIAVGLGIIRKIGSKAMSILFGKKFEPMRPDERQELMDFAQSMVDAGSTIQEQPINALLKPEDIPLNVWLFGEQTEGRRVLVTGEVEIPGTDKRAQFRIPFEDIPSREELEEAFLERGRDIINRYPEKFGLQPSDTFTEGQVWILLPERAF